MTQSNRRGLDLISDTIVIFGSAPQLPCAKRRRRRRDAAAAVTTDVSLVVYTMNIVREPAREFFSVYLSIVKILSSFARSLSLKSHFSLRPFKLTSTKLINYDTMSLQFLFRFIDRFASGKRVSRVDVILKGRLSL